MYGQFIRITAGIWRINKWNGNENRYFEPEEDSHETFVSGLVIC